MEVNGEDLVYLIGKQQVEIYALTKALQQAKVELALPAPKAAVEQTTETR